MRRHTKRAGKGPSYPLFPVTYCRYIVDGLNLNHDYMQKKDKILLLLHSESQMLCIAYEF